MEVQQAMGLSGAGMRGRYMPGMFAQGSDRFTGSQQQPQQEFSLLRAAGKFFQGAVVDTITGLFSFKGLAMMAGAGAICALGGAPLVLAAGLGLGGFQLLKGAYGAASNYASGNYAQAEESFRDIGGGTVAVVVASAGIRARDASAEGVGGKLGALWGDIRGKSVYNFTNAAGEATTGNMYQMMGSRAKTGWNTVYEVFKPSNAAVAENTTVWGRLKGLFVAEESVAGARVAAKEAHALAKEQAALTAECELVESAIAKKLTTATEPAAALAEIKGLSPDKFAQLKSGLGTLAEAEAFAADGAMVAEAAKIRPGITAEMIKGMSPSEFTALQEQVAHATRLTELAAAKPDSAIRLTADKLFPGKDLGTLSPKQLALLDAANGTNIAETAAAIKTSGVVPPEVAANLKMTPEAILSMEPYQIAQLMAKHQMRLNAQAANTPSFLARITNSDVWRNTFGRVDGAAATESVGNSGRFVIGENTFANNGAGFATSGVRRIVGTTAGNVFRDD